MAWFHLAMQPCLVGLVIWAWLWLEFVWLAVPSMGCMLGPTRCVFGLLCVHRCGHPLLALVGLPPHSLFPLIKADASRHNTHHSHSSPVHLPPSARLPLSPSVASPTFGIEAAPMADSIIHDNVRAVRRARRCPSGEGCPCISDTASPTPSPPRSPFVWSPSMNRSQQDVDSNSGESSDNSLSDHLEDSKV